MTNNLESILREARYIINNANELANPEYYLPTLSKFPYILSQFDTKFYEGIDRKRIPFGEIKRYIDLDSIIIDGCSTVGNIEIARRLNYEEKDVSNVIDIVCRDQRKTIEQKDVIIKYFEMKGYEYRFLPNNIYGFKLNLGGEELIVPNLYGIYYYIEVKLPNNKTLYIMIDTAENIFIKKTGLDRTLYIENFGLFSIIYKFFRYKKRDIGDLEEYEEYGNKIKEIINKGFSEGDFRNLRTSFSKKDIGRIRKNLDKYLKEHPNSVYKRLYEVIEYV
jgi:hypothetical protein